MAAESRKSLKLVHSDWSYTREMTSPPSFSFFFCFVLRNTKLNMNICVNRGKRHLKAFACHFINSTVHTSKLI